MCSWSNHQLPGSVALITVCQITHLEEYYLTNYEIDVLKKSAVEMASNIPAHSMVIELGSGLVLAPSQEPLPGLV